LRIQIVGTDLPGRVCGPSPDFPGYENIHVAVQRRGRPKELHDLFPGDAQSATWTLECTTKVIDGAIDVLGPYVQGRPGERFIYLSWGAVDDAATFKMFRRAKLFLVDVPVEVLAAGVRSGVLVGELALTDAKGHPVCARVRPPLIEWSAVTPRTE
jgi:hypothetical protein